MPKAPTFDLREAHLYFSAHCFNSAWDLMDKPSRSDEETEQMIQRCLASLWHWAQRDDCSDQSLSIGYWQAARVFALAGDAARARYYGELCLERSRDLEPFYLGYAYEALARAAKVAGYQAGVTEYLEKANACLAEVKDPESRKMLEADLKSLG